MGVRIPTAGEGAVSAGWTMRPGACITVATSDLFSSCCDVMMAYCIRLVAVIVRLSMISVSEYHILLFYDNHR